MKKEFAFVPNGPKRVKITSAWNLANAQVCFDGHPIMSFATKADFQRGQSITLPDGSLLSVRYGPVEGASLLKGVHATRNGAPLPGSAADPVPAWAWLFIVACILIPVISLGGALPAMIAGGGVSGIVSLARSKRWSVGVRVGACAALTLSCWLSFGTLVMVLARTAGPQPQQQGWHVPFTKAIFMSSSPDTLMRQIDGELIKRGYTEAAITQIDENLR